MQCRSHGCCDDGTAEQSAALRSAHGHDVVMIERGRKERREERVR